MTTTTTITIEGPENLVAHIEGLQATLTKRNARIAQLEDQLAEATNGEPTQAALKKAYRDGWRAAAGRLALGFQEAQRALTAASRPAYDVYVEADSIERTPDHMGGAS